MLYDYPYLGSGPGGVVADLSHGYCGLPVLYEPIFLSLFSPRNHPERLERFLSSLLGDTVTLSKPLTSAGFSEEPGKIPRVLIRTPFLLSSGMRCLGEILIAHCNFPGPRTACYSSALSPLLSPPGSKHFTKEFLLPQNRISKIYTIVILEKSCGEFLKYADHCIHRTSRVIDTGLSLDLLQEYLFISLDLFAVCSHEIHNERDAWLSLLCSLSPDPISSCLTAYPYMQEIYSELASLLSQEQLSALL